MDWSRVKTILIIALLFTNAIIVLFIVYDGNAVKSMPELRQQQLINQILVDKNIENQVPDDALGAESMPQMMAGYQVYDLPILAEKLLGDYAINDGVYVSDEYLLSFKENTLYIVKRRYGGLTEGFTTRRAQEIAAQFIENGLGLANDYKLKEMTETERGIQIDYVQMYGDYFIGDTAMRLLVDADGVVEFERKWMLLQAPEKRAHGIKQYSQALFSALDQLEDYAPTTIKSVDLGYRLEKTVFGYDVKSGDALPYYRFTLVDGAQLFVPALLEAPLQ